MKKGLFITSAMVLLLVFLVQYAASGNQKAEAVSQEQIRQNMHRIQIPFIANNGQMDERVTFYANTFGGTVFVTKDGEIVYALPKSANDDNRSLETGARIQKCRGELHSPDVIHDARKINDVHSPTPKSQPPTSNTLLQGIALKETLIGAKVKEIKGEDKSATKVNYFRGNDQKKWKSNISTYDVVDLGEVYKGIELKLKAYGNNVEKLFYIKPGADPDQIKINLSGIRESKSKVGSQKSEVRSQRSEVGSQKSDVVASNLNSEFRNQILLINEHGEPSRLGEACPELTERACPEPVEWACPEPVEWAERTQQNNITKGASGLWVNEQGQLVAETELGPVTFTKPVAYQEIDGKRVDVAVEYEIYAVPQVVHRKDAKNAKESIVGNTENAGNVCPPLACLCVARRQAGVKGVERDSPHVIQPTTNPKSKIVNLSSTEIGDPKSEYGFKVASYDKSHDLIIDPLLASTFLGGSDSEVAYSIAIDASGNVYVTGYTSSTDFPATVGVYDTSNNGSSDVFVSKLDGGLTSLLASTYLGGSDYEYGYSLALDASGNVCVTGSTKSSDFPTTSGAYDASGDAASDNYDVFVLKLSSDLSNLIASTFLGGSDSELAYSTSLDTDGNIYVTGATKSSDFPTTAGAYDVTGDTSSDNYDVFVSKLNSDLSNLIAATFLGGSGSECAYSMALDASNNIYLAGETESSDFPVTSGAYNTTYNGSSGDVLDPGYDYDYDYYVSGDTFVTKLDSNLGNLLASTFLGGGHARSLAIDTRGDVYVTGYTGSSDFPTTSEAYDTTGYANNYDVFVTKLGSDLSNLLASTYLGGDVTGRDKHGGQDYAWSIAIDLNGDVYVTGYTDSSSFPATSNAYDASGPDENTTGAEDHAFVSKLDSKLGSLLASTFLGGGDGHDRALSLAIDSSGDVYVTGYTGSSDFPTTSGAYNTNINSSNDVFISKLDGDLSADTTSPTPSPTPTPTVTATATPTPTDEDCKAETITTDPEKKLVIKRNQSDTVTVSVLGTDGCPVEGTVVKARLNRRSKKKVSVTSSATTDADGKAVFTVTAYNKKGAAGIAFSPKGLKKKAKLKVKVK